MKSTLVMLVMTLVIAACTSANKTVVNDGFPDAWWQPVAKNEIASWEIAPQSANRSKGEVVLSKRGELGVFSNFSHAPFKLDGQKYASVEGFWQSLKYPEGKTDERLKNKKIKWPYTRKQVAQLTATDAKKAGDAANEIMKQLNINWVSYKGKKLDYTGKDQQAHYEIILRASRAKLKQNPQIMKLLLETKNLKFFSDHKQKPDAPPAYRYHEIYMKLRDELQTTQRK